MYTDSQCVLYGKPLLESGTEGSLASAQVIVPFESQSYSDQEDGKVTTIPACTIKSEFPAHTPLPPPRQRIMSVCGEREGQRSTRVNWLQATHSPPPHTPLPPPHTH